MRLQKEAWVAYRLSKTIVLVGLMGAGKTAIGSLLAQSLGVPFLDSDDALVEASNMSIAEIFERDGEEFFRLKELQVINRLLDGPPAVLSTGGGAFLTDAVRSSVQEKGFSVWLTADLDVLWNRVKGKRTRPLLKVADPYGKLKELFEARNPVYQTAHLSVEGDGEMTKEQMRDKLLAALLADPKAGVTEIGATA